MQKRILQQAHLQAFQQMLMAEEKSAATIEKYVRTANAFLQFANGAAITKALVLTYKNTLMERGSAVRSINAALAGLNRLFAFLGWQDCSARHLKMQQETYSPEEKQLTRAEYLRLVHAARQQGSQRMALLLQTICATGIRVSELPFITVDAVRRGAAVVSLKGKTRTVLLVRSLQKKLLRYAAEQKIGSGCIFITRSGKPMNRTNIWREMKRLCAQAAVDPRKVFPHNLRHLFARAFYEQEKDIAKLADILGHSSIDTTRIYIMTTCAEHRQRMERLHLIL